MLSQDQIEKMKLLLASSAWNEVMKPAIQGRGNQLIKMILMAPSERPEPYKAGSDDILRGEIRGIEWLLAVWVNEVNAYDHNKRLDELDRDAGTTANP